MEVSRAVAATWSPRSRAAIVHSRPKPRTCSGDEPGLHESSCHVGDQAKSCERGVPEPSGAGGVVGPRCEAGTGDRSRWAQPRCSPRSSDRRCLRAAGMWPAGRRWRRPARPSSLPSRAVAAAHPSQLGPVDVPLQVGVDGPGISELARMPSSAQRRADLVGQPDVGRLGLAVRQPGVVLAGHELRSAEVDGRAQVAGRADRDDAGALRARRARCAGRWSGRSGPGGWCRTAAPSRRRCTCGARP